MKKIYLLITLLSTGYFYGQANYLFENFDYTAAAPLTSNNWFQTGTTVTTPILVNPAGLSWAGYIGSGVGLAALLPNTGQDVNRPIVDISDGSVYASFLFRPSAAITSTSTGNYFFHFGRYDAAPPAATVTVNSAFRARAFVLRGTDPATQFKLGLNFNAGDFISPSNVTADLDITKTYLVVVKYTFVDGIDNDTVSMFVFPEGANISSEPAVPTLGPYINTLTTATPPAPGPDLSVIQCVALRQSSTGQNCIVDGIVVRKVWDLTSAGTPLSIAGFSQNNTLKVYPNPTQNNRVSIYSSIEGNKEITLFDTNGRMVLQKTMTSDELDLTSVNKGVYLLQTKVGDSTSTTKLIVN